MNKIIFHSKKTKSKFLLSICNENTASWQIKLKYTTWKSARHFLQQEFGIFV
jgi:hypothetical protein